MPFLSANPLSHLLNDLFSRSLLDPRNGAAHDCAASTSPGPVRRYVIASVPRSGSTLLARLLWGTDRVGRPKEYLNPMQLRDWEVRLGRAPSRQLHGVLSGAAVGAVVGRGWSADRLVAHLQRVEERRSVGGWLGLKLHHHHFERYGGMGGLHGWLESARWLRIRREDRLGQAISWARALQSGRWAAWQEAGRKARYSREAIRRRLVAIERAEAGWDAALQGREVHALTYEALVADPVAATRGVLTWLGVPDASTVAIPPPPTRRQADAITELWRSRWRSGT